MWLLLLFTLCCGLLVGFVAGVRFMRWMPPPAMLHPHFKDEVQRAAWEQLRHHADVRLQRGVSDPEQAV